MLNTCRVVVSTDRAVVSTDWVVVSTDWAAVSTDRTMVSTDRAAQPGAAALDECQMPAKRWVAEIRHSKSVELDKAASKNISNR